MASAPSGYAGSMTGVTFRLSSLNGPLSVPLPWLAASGNESEIRREERPRVLGLLEGSQQRGDPAGCDLTRVHGPG